MLLSGLCKSCFAAVSAAVLVLPATAAVSFTFDTGAEGWTVTAANGGVDAQMDHVAVGGNPGGFLRLADLDSDDFSLIAPGLSGGVDWSAFLGGKISFDVRNLNNESPDYSPFGTIVLAGGGFTFELDPIAANQPPADDAWHHYEIPLTSALFGPNLAAALANLTSLQLMMEFHIGVNEVAGFDNFRIEEANLAPVPAPWALLLGAGVAGAALRRRRA